jgi:hypothetical protein
VSGESLERLATLMEVGVAQLAELKIEHAKQGDRIQALEQRFAVDDEVEKRVALLKPAAPDAKGAAYVLSYLLENKATVAFILTLLLAALGGVPGLSGLLTGAP